MGDEKGDQIFDLVLPPVSSNAAITLDFKGCRRFATPFFNRAVGRLYGVLDERLVDDNLRYDNLSDLGVEAWKDSVENAKRKYAQERGQRRHRGG